MKYTNPILQFDFSDPDVIRVGNDFYMVASSFNYVPGIPLLHSKNLVEWELINYVVDILPKEFDEVLHGEGLWAPSIRYHDSWFYCIILISLKMLLALAKLQLFSYSANYIIFSFLRSTVPIFISCINNNGYYPLPISTPIKK